MLPVVTKNHPFIWTGMFFLIPTLVFAQKELKNYERVRYADVGYAKLGFGEVNQRLLTEKQVAKLNRHIERIQAEYGAVVIFGSLIPEEVVEWESGNLSGLPRHYLGEDRHAARNHVMILFDDEDGQNWIRYGCDTSEFEETIYASAHYENKGFFLTNSARMAFHDVFQHKIQQSKLLEAMPEAEAY